MKNTVVVTNASGVRVTIQGRRIKSLRETIQDQEFPFKKDGDAVRFADSINGMNQRGLSALYAGTETEESSVESGVIDMSTSSDDAAVISTLALEKELKELTVKDLKAMCKSKGLSNYSALNEDELIQLIIKNTQE
ncbi:Rho termination factor N-terminal domain-containing protein (plasmid) [Moritella sp. 24]|uniref:Rho termination factor N-terminal domain-containing protein n=1 Tax=Moritella sp. 24 TaxID=2746230 RepID=UPI001BA93576|nr:Rho termination factor N-terminal domain-containing protein [Moritella sp. 24]QUM78793.1 Rho termination factor N-terminal domain-containing protein [Moritella sp. 24]